MKLWTLTTFYALSLLILSGCGAKPTPKKEAVIDSTLPIVELTQEGTVIDSNVVALEWKSIQDQRVKGIYIYKMSHDANKTEPEYYDTIKSRFITHYVDSKILPDTRYSYFFRTFSDDAESMDSKSKTLNSLPVLDSVSWIHALQDMPRSAKIIWRPHTNEKVKAYIIERQTLEETKWEVITTLKRRLSAEFIDTDLKDKYVYKYRVRVLTYDGIKSTPSQIVKVVTKALPKEVTNIRASRDLPRKIDITWDKTKTVDFKAYNVYRSISAVNGYKLIAKLSENFYSDMCDEDAKQYFYRVSVVDGDDLESKFENNSIQGLTLSKPNAPALVESKLINNKVKILWSKTDPRAVSYIVSKRYKKGWFEEIIEEFEGIKGSSFIDPNIEPNNIYFYKVYCLDKNGIKSEASIEVQLKSQKVEITKVPRAKQTNQQAQSVVVENVQEVDNNTIVPTQDFN